MSEDRPTQERARPGRPSNQSLREAGARKRRPMSVPMAKMYLPEIPGFHSHWINDYPGRVDQALAGGYEFIDPNEVSMNEHLLPVNSDLGSRVSMLVGRNDSGGPLRAFAMKIRNEYYDEDQAALAARNDKVDEAIRRGQMSRSQGKFDPRDDGTEYVNASLKTNLRRSF